MHMVIIVDPRCSVYVAFSPDQLSGDLCLCYGPVLTCLPLVVVVYGLQNTYRSLFP